MAFLREYRFRKLFGLTHEQYLDEPVDIVDWLIAIDNEVNNG